MENEKITKEEKKEKETLRKALQNQSKGYILAGLGLVSGLAWNDAIRTLIETVFPFSKDEVWVKFIYAIVITLVVVLIGRYVFKAQK
ncbi:MAG TPA: DUF5654 family protein [Candidatus Paceibacterota bacterium]|nr:DUF5654 family protein [Candidatus Paceibacterota bacterium]